MSDDAYDDDMFHLYGEPDVASSSSSSSSSSPLIPSLKAILNTERVIDNIKNAYNVLLPEYRDLKAVILSNHIDYIIGDRDDMGILYSDKTPFKGRPEALIDKVKVPERNVQYILCLCCVVGDLLYLPMFDIMFKSMFNFENYESLIETQQLVLNRGYVNAAMLDDDVLIKEAQTQIRQPTVVHITMFDRYVELIKTYQEIGICRHYAIQLRGQTIAPAEALYKGKSVTRSLQKWLGRFCICNNVLSVALSAQKYYDGVIDIVMGNTFNKIIDPFNKDTNENADESVKNKEPGKMLKYVICINKDATTETYPYIDYVDARYFELPTGRKTVKGGAKRSASSASTAQSSSSKRMSMPPPNVPRAGDEDVHKAVEEIDKQINELLRQRDILMNKYNRNFPLIPIPPFLLPGSVSTIPVSPFIPSFNVGYPETPMSLNVPIDIGSVSFAPLVRSQEEMAKDDQNDDDDLDLLVNTGEEL